MSFSIIMSQGFMLNAPPRTSLYVFGLTLRFGYYFHSLRRWEATMESQNKKPTIHHGLLGTQESDNTILYVQLDDKLFLGNDDNLITAIAHNVQEAARLVEVGFGYATERQQ